MCFFEYNHERPYSVTYHPWIVGAASWCFLQRRSYREDSVCSQSAWWCFLQRRSYREDSVCSQSVGCYISEMPPGVFAMMYFRKCFWYFFHVGLMREHSKVSSIQFGKCRSFSELLAWSNKMPRTEKEDFVIKCSQRDLLADYGNWCTGLRQTYPDLVIPSHTVWFLLQIYVQNLYLYNHNIIKYT